MKILLAITTTRDSSWCEKIKEAKKLGITEVAFFLTCLNAPLRQEFYRLAKAAGIKKAPFVHLRSDMSPTEIDYLIKEFGTKIFNIHSQKDHKLTFDLTKYRAKIYMENNLDPIADEAREWAGVCLDVSHYEDKRLRKIKDLRQDVTKALRRYKVGVWHLNAIVAKPFNDKNGIHGYDCHHFTDLKELDYCRQYQKYLPQYYIALELENSLVEQLQAKAYITKLFKKS